MRLWATFATARRVLSMVCLFLASLRLLTVLIPIWFTGIVDPKHQMTYLHYLLKTYYLDLDFKTKQRHVLLARRPA